jgi:hypothetical protein
LTLSGAHLLAPACAAPLLHGTPPHEPLTRRSTTLTLGLTLAPGPAGLSRCPAPPTPAAAAHRQRGAEELAVPPQLLELGEAWRAAQGGGARFVVFTDGSQGGEAELSRRMRIGQLQGALMSVVGLREIEPSIAALQKPAAAVPQLGGGRPCAREDAPGDGASASLDKGFVVIGWGDAGWVRFFSKGAACGPTTSRA